MIIISPLPLGGPVHGEFKCHCLVIQFGDDGRVERLVVLSDSGSAQDMTRYPCPDERMKEAIQEWLAQSPARPQRFAHAGGHAFATVGRERPLRRRESDCCGSAAPVGALDQQTFDRPLTPDGIGRD